MKNATRQSIFRTILLFSSAALFFAALTGPAAADDRQIIRVPVTDQIEVNALVFLDLDVWSVRDGWATILATEKERALIRRAGFRYEVEVEDVEAHLQGFWTRGEMADYHTFDEVVAGLELLAQSLVATLVDMGDSIEGRDILAIKISDNPEVDEGEPRSIWFGCQHAREWISVEVPLLFASYLITQYGTNPTVTAMVDAGEIWIVPVVNPDGYVYTWEHARYWRKNRRDNGDGTFGVDPHRNWGYMWGGAGSSPNPRSDIYHGTEPFSEPETQALRDLILEGGFNMMMDWHSFGELILYPWGFTRDLPPGHARFEAVGRTMAALIYGVHGHFYRPQPICDLYLVSGGSADWMFGETGAWGFSIELRGYDFALPSSQIIPTFEENLAAALYLLGLSVGDTDADGVVDAEDNCPGVANPYQADTDGDLFGDACDLAPDCYNPAQGTEDQDGDGIYGECDNCPEDANPAQVDADGDDYGAACDCDDTESAINPEAIEICSGGVDEDCDGLIDAADAADCTGWRLLLDGSYGEGMLHLNYTLRLPEPATWSNTLIQTTPFGFVSKTLFSVPLPAIPTDFTLPLAFPFESSGEIGIQAKLKTGQGVQATAFEWIMTK